MRRLLLVDGDASISTLLRRRLEQHCSISHAATKAQAVEVLRRDVVDLVLLESRLPDGCGLNLLAQIRGEHPALPTVMVTGHGSETVCATAFKLGVTDYLKKPVHPSTLIRVVKAILPEAASDAITSPDSDGAASTGSANELRDERPIREAVRFIQDHYHERLTLAGVGRVVGLGKFSLSRRFRTVMTVSFRTYLLHLRITRAAELLAKRSHLVIEIAEMAGFNDLSAFNKAFKKQQGLPPTAYRKRVAQELPGKKQELPSEDEML